MITLNNRQLCDFELIINGGFNPLNGFLNKDNYFSVLKNMRLVNNILWPMPICLAINEKQANEFKNLKKVDLKDVTGIKLGELIITDKSIYKYDWKEEAKYVFNSDDYNHPYTKILKEQYENGYNYYIGGRIINSRLPPHYDFKKIRLTPKETKEYFKKNNWNKIVGFQTRNPMHKSHYELTQYALNQAGKDAKLMIHPVVGVTQDCDIDYHTRVRCYRHIMKYYKPNTAKLSLLPLSMRMAGPREAVWHAIIRKNYGCTHFVAGRDHAGPSYKKKNGNSFFEPYAAQNLLLSLKNEIGIEIIISKLIVYAEEKKTGKTLYSAIDKLDTSMYNIMRISGTQQREMLKNDILIPEWFSFPEIILELKKQFKILNNHGLCIYFVGLSGSGKTTLANALIYKLKEMNITKKISYLDGDVVRKNLSKGLTFSKKDRSINVRRIGYVASEIVKHGGICVVANIAPYRDDRRYNRKNISKQGNYFQIWVNTSLEVCEKRDVKGLYKLARQGIIKQFTGISDPFEKADESNLTIDGNKDINEILDFIIKKLSDNNYI